MPFLNSLTFRRIAMTRARVGFAATLVATALCADAVLAGQAVSAPQLTPVLAGRKFTPPVKGQADVEFTAPKTSRNNKDNTVITTITVRNISTQPIARLRIDEVWYERGGAVLTAGRGVINGVIQPQEIQTVTITTPWKAGMNSNNYQFSHANGTVKPHRVQKLDLPKDAAAATPAPTTQKP
jgi:hypothetical protein